MPGGRPFGLARLPGLKLVAFAWRAISGPDLNRHPSRAWAPKVAITTEDDHRRCPPWSSSYNYLLLKEEKRKRDAKMSTPLGAFARARETRAVECGEPVLVALEW